ncbi:MAG: methyltransferase domain-containing protein [Desulfuromonadaceae bacterium]|nr:methyltransferase domain-containing protein [Desulfuromonadaceae bacterium]
MKIKVKDFNGVASTWDEKPRRVKLAAAVAESIRKYVDIPPRCRAMDFGCGTGLVTFNLIDVLEEVVAVDRAAEMLEVVEQKAADLGATGVSTKLVGDDLAHLGCAEYDLIYSSMVLHHLPEIEPILEGLITALKPGGGLALSDLEDDDGTFHDNPEGLIQTGIQSTHVIGILKRLGLVELGSTQAHTIVKQRPEGDVEYPVFLVWGKKEQ